MNHPHSGVGGSSSPLTPKPGLRAILRRLLVRKREEVARCYFLLFNQPEVDSQYGRDPAYTGRCHEVATRIYAILRSEIPPHLKQSYDQMDPVAWELCQQIAQLVEGVFDAYDYGINNAAERHSVDLLKLSRCFIRYGLASEPARRALNELYRYVRNDDCTGFPGVTT